MFNAIGGIWFGWIVAEVIKLSTGIITKDLFVDHFINTSIYTAIIILALKLELGK